LSFEFDYRVLMEVKRGKKSCLSVTIGVFCIDN
jgi:hypothetical protein